MTEERPIAWAETARKAPVLDAQGEKLGEVRSVLGDDEANLFHGMAVKLEYDGRIVEIPAAKVDRITTERVFTSVEPNEIGALTDYHEQHWFESARLRGIFRKR